MRHLTTIIILLCFVTIGLAQETTSNRQIDPCTNDELSRIAEITTDFRERYAEIGNLLPEEFTELRLPLLDEVGGDITSTQILWHAISEPEIPNCSMGIRIIHIYSRLIDEMSIAYLMVEFELSISSHDRLDLPMPLADIHVEVMSEIAQRYEAINADLDDFI